MDVRHPPRSPPTSPPPRPPRFCCRVNYLLHTWTLCSLFLCAQISRGTFILKTSGEYWERSDSVAIPITDSPFFRQKWTVKWIQPLKQWQLCKIKPQLRTGILMCFIITQEIIKALLSRGQGFASSTMQPLVTLVILLNVTSKTLFYETQFFSKGIIWATLWPCWS